MVHLLHTECWEGGERGEERGGGERGGGVFKRGSTVHAYVIHGSFTTHRMLFPTVAKL